MIKLFHCCSRLIDIDFQLMSLIKSLIFTIASIPIYYTLAIIFGAPFFSEGISTLEFSIVLSVLTVLPICLSTSAKQQLIAQLVFDLL